MHDMTPVKDWFIQHISWRRFWLVGVFLIVCAGIFFGALIAYGNAYTARVLPGVFIGDMAIGGLDEAALRQYLESMYAKLSDQGIGVVVKGDSGQKRMTLYPAVLADEDVLEFFDDDIQKEVNYFLSYRKKGNILVRGYQTAYSRLIPTKTHLLLFSRLTLFRIPWLPRRSGTCLIRANSSYRPAGHGHRSNSLLFCLRLPCKRDR